MQYSYKKTKINQNKRKSAVFRKQSCSGTVIQVFSLSLCLYGWIWLFWKDILACLVGILVSNSLITEILSCNLSIWTCCEYDSDLSRSISSFKPLTFCKSASLSFVILLRSSVSSSRHVPDWYLSVRHWSQPLTGKRQPHCDSKRYNQKKFHRGKPAYIHIVYINKNIISIL